MRHVKIPHYLFLRYTTTTSIATVFSTCILILLIGSPDSASFLSLRPDIHSRLHPSLEIDHPPAPSSLSFRWVDGLGGRVPEIGVQRRRLQRCAGQIATAGQSVSRSRTVRIFVNVEKGLRMLGAAVVVVIDDLVAVSARSDLTLALSLVGVRCLVGREWSLARGVGVEDETRCFRIRDDHEGREEAKRSKR